MHPARTLFAVAATAALTFGAATPAFAAKGFCYDEGGHYCDYGHVTAKFVEQPNGTAVTVLNTHFTTTLTVDGVETVVASGTDHSQSVFAAGAVRELHERSTSTFTDENGAVCTDYVNYHVAGGRVIVDDEQFNCVP